MPSLYAPMNGVNTKQKSVYGLMSGVNTKQKNGYGLMSGVNTKVFSSGVEWAYQATVSGNTSYIYTYGATTADSAYMGMDNTTGNDTKSGACEVIYALKEPITIPAGSTVTIVGGANIAHHSYESYVEYSLKFNGAQVWTTGSGQTGNKMGAYMYTVPSTVTVSSITAVISEMISKGQYNLWDSEVTINPLGGDSFLLNSTGKSN